MHESGCMLIRFFLAARCGLPHEMATKVFPEAKAINAWVLGSDSYWCIWVLRSPGEGRCGSEMWELSRKE